jgi:hypothetical protein
MYSKYMELMAQAKRFCARSYVERRSWRFSANFRDAWLRWKRAAARISGAVRLVSWATKCA